MRCWNGHRRRLLADKLGMRYEQLHFAYMSDRELRKAIRVMKDMGLIEMREEA